MPASAQPPPDLPSMPGVSEALSGYLRRFSLWCRTGFADRMPAREAVPGVLVEAFDAPIGETPKVYLIRVNSAGVVSTLSMPIGAGRP